MQEIKVCETDQLIDPVSIQKRKAKFLATEWTLMHLCYAKYE